MAAINYIIPENKSGYIPAKILKPIMTIKKRNFIVVNDFSVGGDAPKNFIKIYRYGRVKRKNRKGWIKYIAKTGHKWYPNESITEHLLNSIGKTLGLLMANSELAMISGQLRFLSEYFLDSKEQELVHGVDIFAGYLSDKDFVEEIEERQMARTFFTFQFAVEAIKHSFPIEYEYLTSSFVKLLVFDGIIGNNDRHFYNWGVVKSINSAQKPYFSPIFDTARGLFWNDSESKITAIMSEQNRLQAYLRKYIKKSLPKIGWEGEKNLNHFQLIQKIKNLDPKYAVIINKLVEEEQEAIVLKMINSDFSMLLSPHRKNIIIACVKLRFKHLRTL